MDPLHTEFWDSAEYRAFAEALSIDRIEALRDLLLLAAFADDLFTMAERTELAYSLRDLPHLGATLTFDTADAVDYIDLLFLRHEREGDQLIIELLARLGDEINLSHALEAMVVLMSTNGTETRESLFARRVGVLMDLKDDFVDRVLAKYGWAI